MKFILPPELLLPFILSNAIAIWVLWLSFRKPNVAKGVLAVLFLGAAGFNLYMAFTSPSSYLGFQTSTFSIVYREFIRGPFAEHTTMIVSTIGVAQLFIATSMLLENLRFKFGCIAGIVFGLAIAPLGAGSAFPSTLVLSLSFLILLLKKEPYNLPA